MRFVLLIALVAAPAAAQFTGRPAMPVAGPAPSGWGGALGDTYRDIGQGKRSGQLSRHEAHQLRRQAGFIGMLSTRYAADGLSDAERHELTSRELALHDEVENRRSGAGPAGSPRR